MKKQILSFLSASALILSLSATPIFAAGSTDVPAQEVSINSDIEVSNVFIDFINEGFNNPKGFEVKDSNGLDVTEKFIESVKGPYYIGDYKTIKKVVQDQNLTLSNTVRTQIENHDGLNKNSAAIATVSGESVTKEFYHVAQDSTGRFSKEWKVALSGTFSYTNNFQVTSASGPSVRLTYAPFGAMFSPAIDNVRTSNSYSGYKASFVGSYDMRAVMSVGIGNLPVNTNLNFGSYTESFSAYPSAMQN
ncbi:hypothetical protein [Paenibacillus tuaregi]|uniref:hypothetical protein n=1 Tax=Paenibacillus tuaregi TaxID=1816681 RepID=UPI000838EFDC|nr:hypothetical protein [Paenibacillus tuaregi]